MNHHPVLVEGDMLRLRDGSLWVVKGCYHPPEGVVAVPRVFEGRKIKRLSEAYLIVWRYYRHYMRFLPELGKVAPVIPHYEIYGCLKSLGGVVRLHENLSRLHDVALDLIKLLSGRGLECGLSGSLLGGYYTEDSDVDLVCVDQLTNSYEVLRELRDSRITENLSLSDALEEALSVSELVPSTHHVRILQRKLTQGKFRGIKYTLRVLDCGEEKEFLGPYDTNIEELVIIKLLSTSHKTPAVYRVSLLRPELARGANAHLISYRARLTELPQGTLIKGRGLIHIRYRDELLLVDFDSPNSFLEFII
ncbi:MAG: hypothetical protein ACP5KB_07030 [Thermoprotei archaeon]